MINDRIAADPETTTGGLCQHGNMRHQPHRPESFADFVRRVGSSSQAARPDARPWPQPIREGRWTDDDGSRWHIRGGQGQLPHRVLRRLLNHPDLRVLHVYGLHPTQVSGTEREALLERVERYFAGEAPPYSEFRLAEFRDDDHRVMLVIEEAC
jgi:hypothetical protein